jgi:hypothetical protein
VKWSDFAPPSCQTKPSPLVFHFLDKCIICIKSKQKQAPDTFFESGFGPMEKFGSSEPRGDFCINRSQKEEKMGWNFWQTL